MKNSKFASFYKCETCAASQLNLKASTGRVCLKYKKEVYDTDFCSDHLNHAYNCERCGQPICSHPTIYWVDEKTSMLLCETCNNNIGKCQTCIQSERCAFEEDKSSTPKIVHQQIRQGAFVSVIQTKNPKLVEITCQRGCPCWDQNSSTCLKKLDGVCQQYHVYQV